LRLLLPMLRHPRTRPRRGVSSRLCRGVTTSAGPEADRPPDRRQWTWEHPDGPHWLLLGDVGFEGSHEGDIPLTLCAEVEGLFVDLPSRPRERFTLVGCTPDGALADLLDRLLVEALGTERAWLGDISFEMPYGTCRTISAYGWHPCRGTER
jgi:hypothetical protein